jgi:2-phosphosulfolactate phosphatase
MCTTNGTRALLAASEAALLLPAALVNARAAASALAASRLDIALLCAGTAGEMALEDLLGAASVIDELDRAGVSPHLDATASKALQIYHTIDGPLEGLLRRTRGGENIIRAGLDADIDFAARVNSIDVVGVAAGNPLIVTLLHRG